MSSTRGRAPHDLPAAGYPWSAPVRSGVIRADGLEAGPLSTDATRDRTPVVAVGSNSSAEVLARKMGDHLAHGILIVPAVVENLVVGHSAHVSARGYVAAAPTRRAGKSAPVAVCWFDRAQLAVLDATEPNYRRITLPDGMPCRLPADGVAGGAVVEAAHAQVYDSIHGVLGQDGAVLPLMDQAGVLAWLADRLPPGSVPRDHAALADPAVRERIRQDVVRAGLRLPSDL